MLGMSRLSDRFETTASYAEQLSQDKRLAGPQVRLLTFFGRESTSLPARCSSHIERPAAWGPPSIDSVIRKVRSSAGTHASGSFH